MAIAPPSPSLYNGFKGTSLIDSTCKSKERR
jgi:hypothetical protein